MILVAISMIDIYKMIRVIIPILGVVTLFFI